MSTKKRIFLFVALLYILYIVFPLFKDVFGIPVWLPSFVTSFTILIMYPKAFNNKVFYWFLVYAFLLAIYLALGFPLTVGIGSVADSKKIIIEYAFILPCISIFCVLTYLSDSDLDRRLLRLSILVLFVSFLVAIPLMQKFNSLREALMKSNQEDLYVAGLPSYSLMHAYTLFLPVLCYCTKVLKGNHKLFSFIGLIVLCFVIYDTFVTTSLILMIGVLLFTLFHTEGDSQKSLFIMSVVTLLIYVLYENGFFIYLIDGILPAFEETAVEPKLIDMRDSMTQGYMTGDSLTGRQDYHSISLNSFFQNPLFGGTRVGGHSSLMDRLGGMGLIVGGPFILIIVSFVKKMNRFFKSRTTKTYFCLGIVVGFVYLYNKGNWGAESWLFYMVLLPLGLLVAENYIMQNNCEHKR